VRSDGDAILDGRGLSPAALGLGAGSDTNGRLAVAVIGGLVSSTLLTLVVIPSVYSLVEHRISRFHKNVNQ
jgi:HAE1 family hydrophobic/amphiphilic exporter-1